MPATNPWHRALIAAALIPAVCLAATPSHHSGPEECPPGSNSIEVFEATISAEINAHGDLLLFLDTDGDAQPDRAYHASVRVPASPEELVRSIQTSDGRAEVSEKQSGNGIPQAVTLSLSDSGHRWMLRSGPKSCGPQGSNPDFWLDAFATYHFDGPAQRTEEMIARLRNMPLIFNR